MFKQNLQKLHQNTVTYKSLKNIGLFPSTSNRFKPSFHSFKNLSKPDTNINYVSSNMNLQQKPTAKQSEIFEQSKISRHESLSTNVSKSFSRKIVDFQKKSPIGKQRRSMSADFVAAQCPGIKFKSGGPKARTFTLKD